MSLNFFIFFVYYVLIIISVFGYGLCFNYILNNKNKKVDIGYSGLFGLILLILYSYFSNNFVAHSKIHNLLILLIGLSLCLFFFIKKIKIEKNLEILILILVFLILFFSVLMGKNHDDFHYYHFPYTYYLTQDSFHIGIGQFNHGFRTPSSIFYLNSLFYLPGSNYYLFNFGQVLILGFFNIIILNKILNEYKDFLTLKAENNLFISFLCLISFIFVNIFFYRISEHGTDRSAQILIFLLIIEIYKFIQLKNLYSYHLSKIYLLLAFIISLKAFYILYVLLLIPVYMYVFKKLNFYNSLKFFVINKFFLIPAFILFSLILTYIFNTGCLVYPVAFTCIESLSWSIPKFHVIEMNQWYQLWSKAGATPNLIVENREEYIQGFNWVYNWINDYFFSKVSDLILGLLLVIITIIIIFWKNFKIKYQNNKNLVYEMVYFILLIFFLEWFFNHPALRYGGYVLITLLLFIPILNRFDYENIDKKKFFSAALILILISNLVFISRNIHRIYKEKNEYQYSPLVNPYYKVDDRHFRLQIKMNKLISDYLKCNKEKTCKNDKNISIRFNKVIFETYK